VEMLIVVVVLGIIAVLAGSEVFKANIRGKASTETENLRMIEAAKALYVADNPGKELSSEADLLKYLPDGKIPISPWGVKYNDVANLSKTVSSPANGDPTKEPAIGDLYANGFNDLAEKGFVYLQKPTPPPIGTTPTPTVTPRPGNNTAVFTLEIDPPGRNAG